MESFSFARARTLSTSSTSSSDSESLVTPITPRFAPSARAMALRAPCLKRNSSAPPTSPWRGTTALPGLSAPLASGCATPTLATVAVVAAPMCSFAAPRSFSAAAPARSVRFNDSPPEAGVTHSGKHYDRRPIQCTKRDSENDLSLQRCVTYGRDDEESSDASGPEAEEAADTAQAEARWACLKNGTVIGSAVVREDGQDKPRVYPATTVAAANAGSTTAQATPTQPLHPNECSLPVHGVRSFGGLGARQGVESQYTVQPPSPRKSMSSLPHDDDGAAHGDADADNEGDTTTRAAGSSDPLAGFRSKSPNATPRQSPAVRIRWENVEGYFALSASETSDEDPAAVAAEQVVEDLASASPSTASTSTARADSPVRLTSVLMERRGSSSDGSASGSHRSAGSSNGMGSPRRRAPNAKRSPRGSPRQLSSPLPDEAPSSSTVVFPASPVLDALEATPKPDASAATSPLEDTGSVVLVPAAPSASLSSVTLASLGLPSPSAHLSAAGASAGSGSFMLDTSPMSSRCSSTDPWSGVSSDETDGEAGNHPDSPTGGWGSSSCTSPDLAPADVATRLAQAQKQLSAAVEGAQQPHTMHMLHSQQQHAQQLSASPPTLDTLTFGGADAVVPPSSMLPPALDACNTMLGVAPSALRTRRAARAAAVAAEGRHAASLDNSPLLAPYGSCVTTDEEGAMGSSVASAVGTPPVGGAAAAAGVKTRKKCGTKRRSARTSSSEGGGFYSSLDEGALGGF